MALSTAQLSLIEQRVANDGPSTAVAFLLWLFTWFLSGHRFYLGRGGSAVLQILSYFLLIGFIWWIVDGFRLTDMIRQKRDDLRHRLTTDMLAHAGVEA
ncbi:hypothetical protein BSL82_01165 [Tardibacter chloracetimidivorans]|uniref:TM2 domain-containing protein n=1 Tax=Tardibacter chloracetimidivorans TaxID=1921510 RepID=A0A1L3ZR23_9SPHN|nr:TM2 domain-containing protein [Tardibacter chloracetimidivorans]API58075.1 hypothetical protein BSL82_01165 [Tardibacter chloracetimidivorans]